MSKHKGRRIPRIAKLTGTHRTVVIDVESGLLLGTGNDDEPRQTSSRDAASERRSQPPGSPASKLSVN
jgi:hypothetical protein